MELWDIYDENRNLKPCTMVRGEPIKDGDYHLTVHICVFNSRAEMLIQKRQPFKDGFPGMWDVTVGGSAVHGDNGRQAAERELFEEVGIRHDFSGVQPHLTINTPHGFNDIFIIEKDVDADSLSLQYEEVERVMWATEEQILSMIEDGTFIPYIPEFIMLIFRMRGGYGSHKRG
ncbi:MAG: NUDIX domain-containing protein [Clostridia bacterium]|nr:NUDIX domain-containing protein [Clostridia bacterium]